MPEARELYEQILRDDPAHYVALHHLGLILHQTGQKQEAMDFIQRAVALRPDWPDALSNLGMILEEMGRTDEAIAACRQAIALRQSYAGAHCNLALALKSKGLVDEAIAACRQAISLQENLAEAHNLLGLVLAEKGEFAEAISACQRAIALRPQYAMAFNNLGNALCGLGKIDEGIAAYQRAIALNPDNLQSHRNLAYAQKRKRNLDESLAAWRSVLALAPDHAEAHFNIAAILLSQGHLREGFEEYEWRWKCADFTLRLPDFKQSVWDGSPLNGRSLLLYTEQGHGDAIQFIRYCQLASECGGKVIVLCPTELQRLFAANFQQCRFITNQEPLPDFDCHASIMSLARIFQTTVETIPARVPYLRALANDSKHWRPRIEKTSAEKKIGLIWRGSAKYADDRKRSIELAHFLSLAQMPSVQIFNLWKGEMNPQDKAAASAMGLIDYSSEFTDFAATAGLVDQMDLIITVDTALAHLAGAMGKTVWTLLPLDCDWRWMLDRADSPWYPTMRLFCQTVAGDWSSVLQKIQNALHHA
ncbi:MAG TPA: tetratricopeptide repeat protein [Tepidisphaeraceae bacterium]